MKLRFYNLMWIFFAGCVLGYLIETLWCLIRLGHYESRQSLVWGPFSIIYGIGAVLLTVLLYKFQDAQWWKIFLISFFVCSVVEYICSLGQEICFGSVAWDYSNHFLNINGRVCLLYSTIWGLLGVGWAKLVYPLLNKIFSNVHIPLDKVIIWILLIFFIVDCIVSAIAGARMNERQKGIGPSNWIERKVDEHFPDERMEKIYANSQKVDK